MTAESSFIPPPASAYILNLLSEPGNDEVLYAVSPGAGLYRTTDKGDFWQEITPNPEQRTYYTLKIDPLRPERIYAGGHH